MFLNDFIKELKYLLDTVSYNNYDSTIDIINELFNIQCLLTFSQFSRTYGFKFYYVRNDETVCNNNFTRKIEDRDETKKDMLLEVFKFIINNNIKPDVRYDKNYRSIGDFNEHEYKRHLEYYLSNAIECLSVI